MAGGGSFVFEVLVSADVHGRGSGLTGIFVCLGPRRWPWLLLQFVQCATKSLNQSVRVAPSLHPRGQLHFGPSGFQKCKNGERAHFPVSLPGRQISPDSCPWNLKEFIGVHCTERKSTLSHRVCMFMELTVSFKSRTDGTDFDFQWTTTLSVFALQWNPHRRSC